MAATKIIVTHQIEQDEAKSDDKVIFGFWVYLMTDLLMFAALFAAYAVLRNNTFGGPSGHQIFDLPFVLIETLLLLTSSFTCGMALLASQSANKMKTLAAFGTTFVLGAAFLTMEISEFTHLILEGNSPQRSAFLSAFFTLVGTHGLHITSGLLWLGILMIYILKRGLTPGMKRKIMLFGMFWHFLDIVWIFIFTIVYLMGAM